MTYPKIIKFCMHSRIHGHLNQLKVCLHHPLLCKKSTPKIPEDDLQIVFSEGKTSTIELSEQAKQLKMGSLYQQVIDAFLFSTA